MEQGDGVNDKDQGPSGTITTVSGHFGEFVQGRIGPDGPLALITVPAPKLQTHVRYVPATGALTCKDPHSDKMCRAGRMLLDRFGAVDALGRLQISRPIVPALGAGTPTADILCALCAIGLQRGFYLKPEEEAEICLAADGAVDPLMFRDTVLFAPRTAWVLRVLPALPAFEPHGVFAGDGVPTDPVETDFQDMHDAFRMLEDGLDRGDLTVLARAARISAEANQARNPNPLWDDILRIGRATGSLGPMVAHTGSAIGLIYAPTDRRQRIKITRAFETLDC